jgi:hypothetical protein
MVSLTWFIVYFCTYKLQALDGKSWLNVRGQIDVGVVMAEIFTAVWIMLQLAKKSEILLSDSD